MKKKSKGMHEKDMRHGGGAGPKMGGKAMHMNMGAEKMPSGMMSKMKTKKGKR